MLRQARGGCGIRWWIGGLVVVACWCGAVAPGWAVGLDGLSADEARVLDGALATLQPLIDQRKVDGTVNRLSFDELYALVNTEQRAFLDAIHAVEPSALNGSSRRLPEVPTDLALERIGGQVVHPPDGEPKPLDDQYLPIDVHAAYRAMMVAMQRDLGRALLVEPGHRSPAYQLYLFCFYLPKHDYSIRETNRFVALPGCSEHGCPARQAIDFINEQGINGEDHPEEFEALPEYAWLTQHARDYGFALSYPRGDPSGTSFEPWHWHYER